jgi:hypothetical protein
MKMAKNQMSLTIMKMKISQKKKHSKKKQARFQQLAKYFKRYSFLFMNVAVIIGTLTPYV